MERNTLLMAAAGAIAIAMAPMPADAQRYQDQYDERDRDRMTTQRYDDRTLTQPAAGDRQWRDRDRYDRQQAIAPGAYLNLTGTVTQASRNGFVLDYGTGQVNVRMDDWEWYSRQYRDLQGRQVTVRARADQDWARRGIVQVDSIYSPDQHTYYYAPVAGQPHTAYISRELVQSVEAQLSDGDTWIRGTVAAVEPQRGVIRLDSGGVEFDVLTRRLAFDPISDDRPFRLEPGDRVLVAGELVSQPTGRISDRRRQALDAISLVLLAQDRQRMDANLARLEEDW